MLYIAKDMEWDKFKMAQKFLQRANAIHPEDEETATRREKALARQNVYYDCYMSSFGRKDLMQRLHEIIGGNIEMPEDEENLNEGQYRETYVEEAKVILSSIERDMF